MAIQVKDTGLGQLSGKIGEAVVVRGKSQTVVRSIPVSQKSKKAQKKVTPAREQFRVVQHFLKACTAKVFQLGYQVAKKEGKSAVNMASSYLMRNAIKGNFPHYAMDLPKVKISRPLRSTEKAWKLSIADDEAGDQLLLKWELNPFPQKTTLEDDRICMLLYNSRSDKYMNFRSTVKRDALEMPLPGTISRRGDEVHVWFFFISSDGKRVSETQYLTVGIELSLNIIEV